MKKRKGLLTDSDENLIIQIATHSEGNYHGLAASAEIQLLGIRVAERTTVGLQRATWVLAGTTLVLVVVTLLK